MKSREFFQANGQIENDEFKDARLRDEEKSRQKAIYSREKYPDPDLERVLEKIDWDLLRSIYSEYAIRSGIQPQDMNFLVSTAISIGGSAQGSYDAEGNTISINTATIKDRYGAMNEQLAILHTILHEEGHAVSRVECHGLELDRKPVDHSVTTIIGYRKHIKSVTYKPVWNSQRGTAFEAFDEGVNEKLAREVFGVYLQRASFVTADEAEKFKAEFLAVLDKMTYAKEVKLVDLTIKRISEEAGVDEQTVWQAIIRGKFRGDPLDDPELEEELNRILSPSFIDALSGVTGDKMADLMKILESQLKGNNEQKTKNKGFFLKFYRKLVS